MKRILYSTVLLTLVLSFASCSSNGRKSAGTDEASAEAVQNTPAVSSTPETKPAASYVYCCAYDGFVNIRETPSMKGSVIGEFRNGPHGAVMLGEEGEWTKIDMDGVVGYVYTKYVSGEPTVAVDEGIDMKWLEGMWEISSRYYGDDFLLYYGLLIFNNGKYKEYSSDFCEGAFVARGSYRLEGSRLILKEEWNYVMEEASGKITKLDLNPARKAIDGYKKIRFLTNNEKEDDSLLEEWEGSGALMLTRNDFNKLSK